MQKFNYNLSKIIFSRFISMVIKIKSNGVSITEIKNLTIASSFFIKFIEHMLTIWK